MRLGNLIDLAFAIMEADERTAKEAKKRGKKKVIEGEWTDVENPVPPPIVNIKKGGE